MNESIEVGTNHKGSTLMISVGIDVSKRKSTVAVINHLGILNVFLQGNYFVHVANQLIIKKLLDAEIRKGKTDHKDALKLSQ